MMRKLILVMVFIFCLMPLTSSAEIAGTVSDDYEPLYTFAEPYGFKLGGAFNYADLNNAVFMDFLGDHFNSLTCCNETKAYSLLNQILSKKSEDGMPRMSFGKADAMIAWCQERGIGVRGHVLVWDAYMTKWFFHEGYDERKPLADKETMRARLKSYIEQVITHFEEKFPGVIYCWDVVNEAIGDSASEWKSKESQHLRTKRNGESNIFLDCVGDDYVEFAFLCARDTVEKLGVDIKLFYNDYNMFSTQKMTAAVALLEIVNSYAKDESGEYRKLADGIGMQGYLGGYGQQSGCMAESLITELNRAIDIYIKRGYEVQITEMAVRNYDSGLAAKHAEFYGRLFSEIFMQKNSEESNPLTAVCIWGLRDANPAIQDYDYNLNSPYGCLLTSDCKIKTCFDTVYHVLRGE